MTQLALTLPLKHAETATSYVSRLAALNGSQFVQDFCQDMLIRWRSVSSGDDEALDRIVETSGVDRSNLDRHTVFHSIGRTYHVAGNVISAKQLLRGQMRICPRCISEDFETDGTFGSAGRVYWQVSSIRTCHKHAIPLIDLPDADYPRDIHDFYARVRDHWRFILGNKSSNAAPRSASAFERYLVGRLNGETSDGWLDTLSFDVVSRTSEMLGLLMHYGPTHAFAKASSEELYIAGERGYEILRSGPKAINRAFAQTLSKSLRARSGYYTDFGHFARWMERSGDCERLEPIRTIFREHVFKNYPIGKGEMVLGKPCPERVLHSAATIAQSFDINLTRLRFFLKGMRFMGDNRNKTLKVYKDGYFPARESEDAISKVADALGRIEAIDHLNIPNQSFDNLTAANVIKPITSYPGVKALYSPRSLDAFLDALLKNTQPTDSASATQFSVSETCNKTKFMYVDIIRQVLQGKLKKVERLTSLTGINSLLLDYEEVLDCFENPMPDGFTKADLQKHLHVNASTVTYLVREKLLKSQVVRHPRSHRKMALISNHALDEFLEKYVTLGVLAHNIGTQAKHVSAKLEKLDIHPLPLPFPLSKLYMRRDLMANAGELNLED